MTGLPITLGGGSGGPVTGAQLATALTTVEGGDATSIALGAALPLASVVDFSGTSLTPDATHEGKLITTSNAAPITITLSKTAPTGFSFTVAQFGTGQSTFVPASGAVMRQADSFTKTRKIYSMATAFVASNSDGNSAVWLLEGSLT